MHTLPRRIAAWAILMLGAGPAGMAQQKSHVLNYAPGESITLSLPDAFDIEIAARGIRRVRFFAQSPDDRIFVTSMHDLADNTHGSVLILEGWDARKHSFGRITPYLTHLRNPNSIAFWTDPKTGQAWLYVAVTDKLIRYPYHAGDLKPEASPQTLIRFPDYGLNYKYGGWHLTRTIAVAQAGGVPRILVSIGSSCNYCQEREVARASIIGMDPDGGNARIIAQGMRNAVDLRYVPEVDGGSLFATNMGDDHLGDQRPDDTFFKVDPAPEQPLNYGWPACYFADGKAVHDSSPLPSMEDPAVKAHTDQPPPEPEDTVYGKQRGVASAGTNLAAGGGHAAVPDPNADLGQPPAPLKSCDQVPAPYAWFMAHSSPLGFAYFPDADPNLKGSFLVALHGASHPHIATGYRVVRFTAGDRKPHDFITGFLTFAGGKGAVHGRPCGVFRIGPDSFLLSDDYLGLIYYVHPRG
jgi:glucose/arabinose dehydrogenase